MELGRSSRPNTQATWGLGLGTILATSQGVYDLKVSKESEGTKDAFRLLHSFLPRGDIAQFAEGAFDDVGRFAGDAAHGVEEFVEDIF